MKTGLKIAGVLLAGIVFTWAGTLLYWDFRIRGAIRVLDGNPDSIAKKDAEDALLAGGCRSLPCLVDALDPEKPDSGTPIFLDMIFDRVGRRTSPREDAPEPEGLAILGEWHASTTSLQHRYVIRDRVQAWWRRNGGAYHQWWRVWSSQCFS